MADELYPGYDPMIDPNPVTCWGYGTWVTVRLAEEMEANNRRIRESYALWMFDDNFEENALLVRDARKDAMVRQWPELFRD